VKIVDEIIEKLSGDDLSLIDALMKAKVLFHRLGETEAKYWADSESKGYTDKAHLPDYRRITVVIMGNYFNGVYSHAGKPLPIMHLTEEARDRLESVQMRQSIAVIEEYANGDGHLHMPLQPEFYPGLGESLTAGYVVNSAWQEPSAGAMLQIATEVRSRLLDLVLELSEKLPPDNSNADMKEISKEIGVGKIFNNVVLGDGATIFFGDNNKAQIGNSIIKGDFTSLSGQLASEQVADEDIEELRQAIENDEGSPEHDQKEPGTAVSGWMRNMVNKAGEAGWGVSVGTAIGVLSGAINAYYGF
jgi:hypothetical protein